MIKRIQIVLCFFISVNVSAWCQAYDSTLGVKLFPGLATASDAGSQQFDVMKFTISGGIEYKKRLFNSNSIFIQTGINFFQRGIDADLEDEPVSQFLNFDIINVSMLNLNIPLSVVFSSNGLYAGYGFSYNRILNFSATVDGIDTETDIPDEWQSSLGMQLFIGYEFLMSDVLLLDIEANVNLLNEVKVVNYTIGLGLKYAFLRDKG